ncbi:MAG: molecular chaperone HtpG, partial [Kiritimatiellae bacterium]|nr:molecular chaperone HtpG [Kiritimatiellia bacterium]
RVRDITDDETKKSLDDAGKEMKPLLEAITKQLEATVKEVRLTARLTDSPCCLVQDPTALNPTMRRMMEAMGQTVPEDKRILELNPEHALIKALAAETDETQRSNTVELLYGQACLAEGTLPPDPARFNRLVADLMSQK